MGVQLVLLLLLQLYLLHGSAGSSISPSAAIFPAVPSNEGVPADHLKSSTPSVSPLPDGHIIHSPVALSPHKSAPVPHTVEVPAPPMQLSPPTIVPSHKYAPSSQTVPEILPPPPQRLSHEIAPNTQPPIPKPDSQVPVASPPRNSPKMPLQGPPPTVSDSSSPVSIPPPSSRKEIGNPVSAPPKETSNQRSPVNHTPRKGHSDSPTASPPKALSEKPVAVHPSKPGVAPPTPSEHAASPISTSPPSTSTKGEQVPVAAPPKEIFTPPSPVNNPSIKEHPISPISTAHPSPSKREDGTPIASPPKESRQLSPTTHSPAKEHTVSSKSTPPPSISRKRYGMPVAAPPKETRSPKLTPTISISKKHYGMPVAAPPKQIFNKISPMSHPPKKGSTTPATQHPPTVAPNKSPTIPAMEQPPAAAPPNKNPTVPVTAHPPSAAPDKSPVISLAPLHPPTVAKKLRHHHTPPLIHGPVTPVLPPIPTTVTQDSPSPSPSSTISSAQTKGGGLRPPLLTPLASPPRNPRMTLPPPVQVLPPPPPNQDCTSVICSDPYTNSPPGAPCACVFPMKVELRLGVALYTFFPLVSELAVEIAAGVFMKQSQVRIMGANAASQQLEKTDVLIDLVPLGEKFDNTTAFLTYEKFWQKQVAIKSSYFGDYEVLEVSYPGLPPSPPSAASGISIIDGVPYVNQQNNARNVHPLGVDVRRKKKGIGGSIVAIIVLSSFAVVVLCIGAAWLLLLKCKGHPHPIAKTPRTSVPSLAKQSGAAGSTVFGSGISSASLSFGSSITPYTGTAKTFSADEIERATDNFDESRILGEGGFGRVYKGILEDGKEVAVKVLKRDDQQGGREFLAEVEMLSRLHHRNLVKLIGICVEDHSRSLVYELIPNGSVESHLHGVDRESSPLDWGARMKIALGAARGLAYLHEDSSPHVIHRDFKSSNILLEHDFTPKVSDFGLARAALEEGNKHISTRVMGTFGYVAPEYAMTGHLLVKSDVYSYGVVLLELLSGRKPVDMSQPEGQENLVAWARPLLTSKEGLETVIDPTLASDFSFDSLAKVAAIASMCVQPEVTHRPFMGEVVQALKLVCNECDETKETGSESCSQEYTSVVDTDTRTSTGSGHLMGTSRAHAHSSDYDSSPDVDRPLSASDIFTSPRRFWRQSSGSFRRHSSSGPLRPGRNRQFWQRVRGLNRGSISEHGFAYRLHGESR